ncbi:hypothetical protein J6590_038376 [Homalodisca vitripennis]|nr:hypothetical protein J6590_038376 [Homalodisca vitripennis]
MFRSPPGLRSGSKVRRVPLQSADKKGLERSLSDPSASPSPMPGGKQTPTTAYQSIEACVGECISHAGAVDALVAKLKVVVEEAVQTALLRANQEISRLSEELTQGRIQGGAGGHVTRAPSCVWVGNIVYGLTRTRKRKRKSPAPAPD